MNREPTLFDNDRPAARSTDPDTSKEAAAALDLPRRQARVLDVLRSRDARIRRGLTASEVAGILGVGRDTISSRFIELETKKLVRRNGTRVPASDYVDSLGRRRQTVWEAI